MSHFFTYNNFNMSFIYFLKIFALINIKSFFLIFNDDICDVYMSSSYGVLPLLTFSRILKQSLFFFFYYDGEGRKDHAEVQSNRIVRRWVGNWD